MSALHIFSGVLLSSAYPHLNTNHECKDLWFTFTHAPFQNHMMYRLAADPQRLHWCKSGPDTVRIAHSFSLSTTSLLCWMHDARWAVILIECGWKKKKKNFIQIFWYLAPRFDMLISNFNIDFSLFVLRLKSLWERLALSCLIKVHDSTFNG